MKYFESAYHSLNKTNSSRTSTSDHTDNLISNYQTNKNS